MSRCKLFGGDCDCVEGKDFRCAHLDRPIETVKQVSDKLDPLKQAVIPTVQEFERMHTELANAKLDAGRKAKALEKARGDNQAMRLGIRGWLIATSKNDGRTNDQQSYARMLLAMLDNDEAE